MTLCCAALILFCLQPRVRAAQAPETSLRLMRTPDRVEVTGLGSHAVDAFKRLSPEQQTGRLSVRVDDPSRRARNMLGKHTVVRQTIVFTPRFGFRPGVNYVARWQSEGRPALVKRFRIPSPPTAAVAVKAVYPSADRLPENQLKFYVYFTQPMEQGEVYQYLSLFDETDGKPVDTPFLEIGEELWNAAGTRLTLYFDPGRVKRGLEPRRRFGPTLIEGHRYRLVVDGSWKGANGRPLTRGFTKRFLAVKPDDAQPKPGEWVLSAPQTPQGELAVRFREPLDIAMLYRVLAVVRDGKPVRGSVQVSDGETRWRFRPRRPWQPGRYAIRVDSTLEDRAGNSIGRPFEVDIGGTTARQLRTKPVLLPFEIRTPRKTQRPSVDSDRNDPARSIKP